MRRARSRNSVRVTPAGVSAFLVFSFGCPPPPISLQELLSPAGAVTPVPPLPQLRPPPAPGTHWVYVGSLGTAKGHVSTTFVAAGHFAGWLNEEIEA